MPEEPATKVDVEMKKRKLLTAAATIVFCGPILAASNLAACILEKMPGSSNEAVNAAVWQTCRKEFPQGFYEIKKGDGRGLFGFSDGNACTLKKAAGTSWQPSALAISRACMCLYDKPGYEGEMCDYRPVNWNDFTPVQ